MLVTLAVVVVVTIVVVVLAVIGPFNYSEQMAILKILLDVF